MIRTYRPVELPFLRNSSHLRLPTTLARPQSSPIISSGLSVRSLSLQANGISKHCRVGLELLLGLLLESLLLAALVIAFGSRIVGRGLGV